jgi:hypothetical protein
MKIEIQLNRQEYSYDVYHLFQAFYPGAELYMEIDSEEDKPIDEEPGALRFSVTLEDGIITLSGSGLSARTAAYQTDAPPIEDEEPAEEAGLFESGRKNRKRASLGRSLRDPAGQACDRFSSRRHDGGGGGREDAQGLPRKRGKGSSRVRNREARGRYPLRCSAGPRDTACMWTSRSARRSVCTVRSGRTRSTGGRMPCSLTLRRSEKRAALPSEEFAEGSKLI